MSRMLPYHLNLEYSSNEERQENTSQQEEEEEGGSIGNVDRHRTRL